MAKTKPPITAIDNVFEKDVRRLRDYVERLKHGHDEKDLDVLVNIVVLLVDAIESEEVCGFEIAHAFVDISKWIKLSQK